MNDGLARLFAGCAVDVPVSYSSLVSLRSCVSLPVICTETIICKSVYLRR
jgi:hypothetical protein